MKERDLIEKIGRIVTDIHALKIWMTKKYGSYASYKIQSDDKEKWAELREKNRQLRIWLSVHEAGQFEGDLA
jgi:hypothetical protein